MLPFSESLLSRCNEFLIFYTDHVIIWIALSSHKLSASQGLFFWSGVLIQQDLYPVLLYNTIYCIMCLLYSIFLHTAAAAAAAAAVSIIHLSAKRCVHIHVRIHVCICICVWVCICICIYWNSYSNSNLYSYSYSYRIRICICIRIHIHICIHTCILTRIHIFET